MAPYANISAAITPLDKTNILTKIGDIDTLLFFLINLTAEERQDLRKAAIKREGLITGCYTAAVGNSSSIPSSFDMAEWTKDETLVADLREIRDTMVTVVEGIDDTIMALGVERLKQAEAA